MTLNLARPIEDCPVSEFHGPGRRFVFWVQGCALRCTRRCINPEALAVTPRYVTPVARIVEVALRRCAEPGVEGVTVLGGEPTEQADGVAQVFEALRATGLSTMLYSGHTLDALRARADASIERILAATDVLVDGPFVEEERDEGLLWRGSRNQRVIALSPRYDAEALRAAPVLRGFDVVVRADGTVHVSGMHDLAVTRAVTDGLARHASAARRRLPRA
jgi:anaerobic ribonucleoside-triphosphate reductase activating protein